MATQFTVAPYYEILLNKKSTDHFHSPGPGLSCTAALNIAFGPARWLGRQQHKPDSLNQIPEPTPPKLPSDLHTAMHMPAHNGK